MAATCHSRPAFLSHVFATTAKLKTSKTSASAKPRTSRTLAQTTTSRTSALPKTLRTSSVVLSSRGQGAGVPSNRSSPFFSYKIYPLHFSLLQSFRPSPHLPYGTSNSSQLRIGAEHEGDSVQGPACGFRGSGTIAVLNAPSNGGVGAS